MQIRAAVLQCRAEARVSVFGSWRSGAKLPDAAERWLRVLQFVVQGPSSVSVASHGHGRENSDGRNKIDQQWEIDGF